MSSIKIRGFNKVMKNIAKFSRGIDKAGKGSVERVGKTTAEIIKQFAPKNTGALVKGIHYKASGNKGGWNSKIISEIPGGQKGRKVPYNMFIEMGYVFNSPNSPMWGSKKGSTWRAGGQGRLGFMGKGFEYAKKKFPELLDLRIGELIKEI